MENEKLKEFENEVAGMAIVGQIAILSLLFKIIKNQKERDKINGSKSNNRTTGSR